MSYELDIPIISCAPGCPWGRNCREKYQDGTCKGRIDNIFRSLAKKPITETRIEDNSIVTDFRDNSGKLQISNGRMKIKAEKPV